MKSRVPSGRVMWRTKHPEPHRPASHRVPVPVFTTASSIGGARPGELNGAFDPRRTRSRRDRVDSFTSRVAGSSACVGGNPQRGVKAGPSASLGHRVGVAPVVLRGQRKRQTGRPLTAPGGSDRVDPCDERFQGGPEEANRGAVPPAGSSWLMGRTSADPSSLRFRRECIAASHPDINRRSHRRNRHSELDARLFVWR
jgi:hypothetical protein